MELEETPQKTMATNREAVIKCTVQDKEDEEDEEGHCGVCGSAHSEEDDVLIFCDGEGCKVAVHQFCYGVTILPPENEPWLCEPCRVRAKLKKTKETKVLSAGNEDKKDAAKKDDDTDKKQLQKNHRAIMDDEPGNLCIEADGRTELPSVCMICLAKGHESLAWKPATRLDRESAMRLDRSLRGPGTIIDGWVHACCVLWIPESSYLNEESMDIAVTGDLVSERSILKCELCDKIGQCVQCASKRCAAAFHPHCIITELLGPREWSLDVERRWRHGGSKGIGHVQCYHHCRTISKGQKKIEEIEAENIAKSEYELEREARIARNASFLASLGLGNNDTNNNKKSSSSSTSKKKKSISTPPLSGTRRSPRERSSTINYADPGLNISGRRSKEEIARDKMEAEARRLQKRLDFADRVCAGAVADDAKALLRALCADRHRAQAAVARVRMEEEKLARMRQWEQIAAIQAAQAAAREAEKRRIAALKEAERIRVANEREAEKRRIALEKEAAKQEKKDRKEADRAAKQAMEEQKKREAAALREALARARDRTKRIHQIEKIKKKPDFIASDATIAELLLLAKQKWLSRMSRLASQDHKSTTSKNDLAIIKTVGGVQKKIKVTISLSKKRKLDLNDNHNHRNGMQKTEVSMPATAEGIAATIEAEAAHLPSCSFCSSAADDFESAAGAFIPNIFLRPATKYAPQGTLLRVHTRCAHLAPDVYKDEHDVYYNVLNASSRAHKQKCKACNRVGAAIQCAAADCTNFYHVPCAVNTQWAFGSDKQFYCPDHRGESSLECCLDRVGERWVTVANRRAWEPFDEEMHANDDEEVMPEVPKHLLGHATGVHCPGCRSYDPSKNDDYVNCDFCRTWWHPSCAGTSKARALERLDKGKAWMCPDCDQHQRALEAETVCICGARSVDSYNLQMLLCESCEVWHHPACVGISNTDFAKLSASTDPWFCPSCAAKPRVCVCKRPRKSDIQYLSCETCDNEFHPECVGIYEDEAREYFEAKRRGDNSMPYICPDCYAKAKQERGRKLKEARRRNHQDPPQDGSVNNGDDLPLSALIHSKDAAGSAPYQACPSAVDRLGATPFLAPPTSMPLSLKRRYKPASRKSKKIAAAKPLSVQEPPSLLASVGPALQFSAGA